jgi:hypothetical protein
VLTNELLCRNGRSKAKLNKDDPTTGMKALPLLPGVLLELFDLQGDMHEVGEAQKLLHTGRPPLISKLDRLLVMRQVARTIRHSISDISHRA